MTDHLSCHRQRRAQTRFRQYSWAVRTHLSRKHSVFRVLVSNTESREAVRAQAQHCRRCALHRSHHAHLALGALGTLTAQRGALKDYSQILLVLIRTCPCHRQPALPSPPSAESSQKRRPPELPPLPRPASCSPDSAARSCPTSRTE